MGRLVLPANGTVYLDANCFIYSVERIDPYQVVLDPLWQALSKRQFTVITSELTLLEVLVKPLKVGNSALVTSLRTILRQSSDVQMVPITQDVLEEAANLRATLSLKTPDALHAATALSHGCALFVTNDGGFRRVAHLPVTVLSEIVT